MTTTAPAPHICTVLIQVVFAMDLTQLAIPINILARRSLLAKATMFILRLITQILLVQAALQLTLLSKTYLLDVRILFWLHLIIQPRHIPPQPIAVALGIHSSHLLLLFSLQLILIAMVKSVKGA